MCLRIHHWSLMYPSSSTYLYFLFLSFLLPAPPGKPRRCGFHSWVGKIPWRRKWQPSPVFLPGESHGRRSLVGYSPWGHRGSDMTERLHFSLFTFMHWRRKWKPTLVFLPGESQGRRSLVGWRPQGCKESDPTEQLTPSLFLYCFLSMMYLSLTEYISIIYELPIYHLLFSVVLIYVSVSICLFPCLSISIYLKCLFIHLGFPGGASGKKIPPVSAGDIRD